MIHTINYLNHILVQPRDIHQRYDINPACKPEIDHTPDSFKERALHISQLALPLITLYQPLGKPISLLTSAQRLFTHLSLATVAARDGKYKELSKQLFNVSVATFLIASTYFEFKIGMFALNAHDATMGLYNVVNHLANKEFDKATKESLQVMASVLYLAFMATGTLEYLLAMYAILTLLAICQCEEEIAGKRFPEAILCFATAFVRLNQFNKCYEQIQTRDFLLSLQKCKELFDRVIQAKAAQELLTSELADFDGNIEKRKVVFKDASGKEYDFGSYFHEYGKELVKGCNIEMRKVEVHGETYYELDFKINRIFRKEIENVIKDYQQMNRKQIAAVLEVAHSKASDIVVSNQKYPMGDMTLGDAQRVTLKGLGSVIMGSSDKYELLKDRVIIQMDSSKNLFDLHELLCLTGMEKVIQHSSPADIERMKLGHLFRVFYPKEALPLERSDEFFTLPIDQLKNKIVEKSPEMEGIMAKYLGKMEKAEILPGKIRYKITGLADELRQNGATALTAAITGAYDDDTIVKRINTIMGIGMTSNETRASHQMATPGISVKEDFQLNAGDSVFVQMVANGHFPHQFTELQYQSSVRLIIDLEALETGTYQYHSDSFGIRTEKWGPTYSQRPGILEFVRSQSQSPTFGNEVMLKDRIDQKHIKQLIVRDDALKQLITANLRTTAFVNLENGVETINGIPLDKFITTEQQIGQWHQTHFKA